MSDNKKPREFWITKEFYPTANPRHFAYVNEPIYGDNVWDNKEAYFHTIEKSAYEQERERNKRLVEALKKTRGAMVYAYEDRCDQYYKNVLRNIDEALKQNEGEK
jgi:hypothetical protein